MTVAGERAMRRLGRAAVLALAALAATAAWAQDDALPKRPVPYTRLHPKPAHVTHVPTRPAPPAPTAASSRPPPSVSASRSAPNPAAPTPAPAAARPAPVRAPPVGPEPPRPAGARLAPGDPLPSAELQAFVDGWVESARSSGHVAGAAVSVVQGGQTLLRRGYGFADLAERRPVDPDRTLFRLGPISETFTWILVMREVEAGRMRLDQPINRYLPQRVRLPDEGWTRPVTVAELMDQTAGLEDRTLGHLFEREPDRVRPLDLYLREERPHRRWAAGATPSQTSYAAGLAGEAVAFLAHASFERRVEAEITGPLGMGRTTFREPRPVRRGLPTPMPPALARDLATGYAWRAAGYRAQPFEYAGQIAPALAGSSTAGDMGRYMLMLLDDGRAGAGAVLTPRMAHAFRTPMLKAPEGVNGWAHGFRTGLAPGGFATVGHGGRTLAFTADMTLAPQLGLGVFVATNSETGATLSDGLASAIVGHFYAPPRSFPPTGSPELYGARRTFAGWYLPSRRAFGGLEGFVDILRAPARATVSHDGRLILRERGLRSAWVPMGPLAKGLFAAQDSEARLAFRISDGRAVSFQRGDDGATWRPAALWERRSVIGGLAGLTAFAAFATLVGLATRNRRELRQNATQARAAMVQTIQAGLWLTALGLYLAWSDRAADTEQLMYDWPGPLAITASACALVAAALALVTLAATPAIWQGGRRVESWSATRKALFTFTTLAYLVFSVVLGLDGALQPWRG